jgi:hypothetical protein
MAKYFGTKKPHIRSKYDCGSSHNNYLLRMLGLIALGQIIISTGADANMANVPRNSIGIPYVMSAMPNPFRIMWSGDWALAFHAWSTLVDIDDEGNAIRLIAKSWKISPDGLHWQFYLRENLRWSDGSPMLESEISNSLHISLKGTSHTNLSESINTIEVNNSVVHFRLKRTLPAFLANLAYSDWAIVHPKSIKQIKEDVELISLSPCSGPYCISDSQATGTVGEQKLAINNNAVLAPKNPLKEGSIIHHDSCEKLITQADRLLAFRTYQENFTDDCRKTMEQAGFVISKSHPTWILKADFTARGFKNFSKAERSLILGLANHSLIEKPATFGVVRATGLRAPHLFGSLSIPEYEKLVASIVPNNLDSKSLNKRSIKLVTMKQWSSWRSFKWLKSLLEEAKMNVEISVLSKEDFAAKRKSRILDSDFDLIFVPLGTSDPDPDNTWRIAARNLYPDILDPSSIRDAFFEKDKVKRAELYKQMNVRLIEDGRMIPIMMDSDIIGVHKSVQYKGVPQYRCGMTLYELFPNPN